MSEDTGILSSFIVKIRENKFDRFFKLSEYRDPRLKKPAKETPDKKIHVFEVMPDFLAGCYLIEETYKKAKNAHSVSIMDYPRMVNFINFHGLEPVCGDGVIVPAGKSQDLFCVETRTGWVVHGWLE